MSHFGIINELSVGGIAPTLTHNGQTNETQQTQHKAIPLLLSLNSHGKLCILFGSSLWLSSLSVRLWASLYGRCLKLITNRQRKVKRKHYCVVHIVYIIDWILFVPLYPIELFSTELINTWDRNVWHCNLGGFLWVAILPGRIQTTGYHSRIQ